MTNAITIGTLDEGEFAHIVPLLEQALFFQPGAMDTWLNDIGTQHLRVARRDHRLVGGLAFIPMGQWFGGARIPLAGITAVGVAPDQRGMGIGSALMRAMLETLHESAIPLAALYPASVAFYRRSGYEHAASRIIYELPLARIAIAERSLDISPIEAADAHIIQTLHTQRARSTSGNLDRAAMLWRNLLAPKGTYTYLITCDNRPEGYIIFRQGTRHEPLNVRDLCALTPAAGRRLLTLLADHQTMVDTARWIGGPCDPLLHLLPEPIATVHASIALMLRIVDVIGALSRRGYPMGLSGELHLEVRDNLLAWNNRRFVLALDDGHPTVAPGGQGRFRIGVRDLAALYSGYLTPTELRSAGTIEATERDLAWATLCFAGPRPWITDMF